MMDSSSKDPRYEKFRRMLAAYRRKKQVTQTQLAKRLGRPQSFVSKYENGQRRLDLVEFLDVMAALEMSPCDFIEALLTEEDP